MLTDQSQVILKTDWITQLLRDTDNLRSSAVISNALLNPSKLYKLLQKAVEMLSINKDDAIIRLFVESGQYYDLLERLLHTPYDPSDDLQIWIMKSIEKDNFCVTVNGLQKWNQEMHITLTNEVIDPYVKSVGAPLSGIDIYAFIAKGGYTPFGIHEDLDHSLIFHLGPDDKHVWIWTKEQYLELTGSYRRTFDFEEIKSNGKHLIIKPGDCLFIPKGEFHVFQNSGYSAFIGFILFPSNEKVIARQAINMLTINKNETEITFVREYEVSEKIIGQLNSVVCGDPSHTFEQVYEGALFNHNLLKSNGYAIHRPPLTKLKTSELVGRELIRPSCFPILTFVKTDRISIFIRGRLIEMQNIPGILEVIGILNEREIHNYDDLLENLSFKLSRDIAQMLIEKFVMLRGLLVLT